MYETYQQQHVSYNDMKTNILSNVCKTFAKYYMMNYRNICCINCNKTFTMERINIKCDICRALADFQYVFSDYVCETMQLCVSTYVHVQRHLCACMTTLDLKNVLLGVGSYFSC